MSKPGNPAESQKVLCAWCGKPISDEGVSIYVQSAGCDTCGNASSERLKIYCRNPDCPKFNHVIYRKDTY